MNGVDLLLILCIIFGIITGIFIIIHDQIEDRKKLEKSSKSN